MSNTASQQGDPAREADDEFRDARAQMRKQLNHEAAARRARAHAEYDAAGDERRARTERLRALRMLKEARDRVETRAG